MKNYSDKKRVLGIIGRGAVVEKDGNFYYQEKDLMFVEKLSEYFDKIIYAPQYYGPENKYYWHAVNMYKVEFKKDNIELFKLFIKDNFKDLEKIRKRYYQLKSISEINRFLEKVDAVLVFWPSPISLLTIILCKIKGIPYYLYKGGTWAVANPMSGHVENNSIRTIIGKTIENVILRMSDVVFIRGAAESKKNFYYIRGNSKFTIKDFYEREDTCINNEIILLNISPLNPLKGVDIIIRAIKILKDKGMRIRFHHVGAGNVEYFEILEKLIADLNLSDSVKFYGYVHEKEDLIRIMRNSDIFVLASRMEGFPRVVLEAMLQSLPVIASSVGEMVKMMKNEREILFFNPDDYIDLAQKIEKLITNEKLRQKLIKNGSIYSKNEYNKEEPAKFIAKIIKNGGKH